MHRLIPHTQEKYGFNFYDFIRLIYYFLKIYEKCHNYKDNLITLKKFSLKKKNIVFYVRLT